MAHLGLADHEARFMRISWIADDLLEMMLYGYGHQGYSWHEIGISVYEVATSPQQEWYYYSNMMPEEVLLIKSCDSRG